MFYLIATRDNGTIAASQGHGTGIYRRALGTKNLRTTEVRQAKLIAIGRHSVICQFNDDKEAKKYCDEFNSAMARQH